MNFRIPVFALCGIAFVSSLFLSCSFNYGLEALGEKPLPEMVVRKADAQRYENGSISMELKAGLLEIYPTDQVWAAEDVSFIQFSGDGSGSVESEGSAGILLINDTEETYFLGESAEFHLVSDDVKLAAPDLFWVKKLHRLSGPTDGVVRITEGNGSEISGTGFFADTLSHEFVFDSAVSGTLSSGSEPVSGESAEAGKSE